MGDLSMSMLTQQLFDAAAKADAETQEAIDAGDAEQAMRCLQRAAQFHRLAINHYNNAILSGSFNVVAFDAPKSDDA